MIDELRHDLHHQMDRQTLAAQLGVLGQVNQCEWEDERGFKYVAHYFKDGKCKCGETL